MHKNEKRVALNVRLTVVDIKQVSSNFIRICFTSDKPLNVNPFWICPHLKLQFPDKLTGEISFPLQDENNKIIWQDGMRERVRTYSIRAYDVSAQKLTVDFVIHKAGVASMWALKAKVFDQIGLLTMGSKRVFNDQHLVLVGDMSARPAICYTIERQLENQPITAFIEVDDPSDKDRLAKPNQAEVNWIIRQQSQGSQLLSKLLAYPFTESDNLLFVGGMEGSLAQQIRHALKEKYPNLPADSIQIINYWREGLAEGEFKHRD